MSLPTHELLLEIGCEEIPSNHLENLHDEFRKKLLAALTGWGLLPDGEDDVRTFFGPRRLVFVAPRVLAAQADQTVEVQGPPVRIAFDAAGAPTKAAEGFAKTQGVAVADLGRLVTPKGEVLVARKFVPGRSAIDLLADAVPEILRTLPQPKTMRWGAERFQFLRPIHWILALFGGQVVPIEIAGVKAGDATRGHRFRGNAPIPVADFSDYAILLGAAHVAFDQAARAGSIEAGLAEAVRSLGAAPQGLQYHVREAQAEHEFLREVSNLTESPRVLVGSFDERHLAIPAEILVTAMKHHQRYFPIWVRPAGSAQLDAQKLLARFAVVTNLPADAPRETCHTVVAGNERVLRARLADAAFFFDDDRKRPLATYVDALKGRIFLQGLGTVYDKAARLQVLAGALSGRFAALAPCFAGADLAGRAARAALLAKADLGTHVVGEFPELQGTMGRHYATADGEHADVCRAIDEHYQPRFAGDAIPATREGTIVSLADKLDSITGAFALGLEPSGSQDPYALRRQAIGVLRILLQDHAGALPHAPAPLDLDVRELVGLAADALGAAVVKDRDALVAKVTDFLLGRFRGLLLEQGHDTNLVGAVLGTGSGNPADLSRRLQALEAIAGSPEFAPMMIAFKRVMNISKDHGATAYRRELFEAAEHALADAFERMTLGFDHAMDGRDYPAALKGIVALKPAIDAFFDGVLVMADDPAVRANRLALVRSVADRFRRFADFTRVQF